LRKEFPYEVYSNLKFMIPTGFDGDSFTRYALRIQEMYESLQIVYECLDNITESCIYSKKLETMEDVIAHFKYYSLNFLLPKSVEYLATESPKGEFGIFLVANGTNKPERMYLRAPGYFHLQGLDMMTRNGLLSDLVTIIGSQDIVFGEIDR
jgi:NADH-quinone oxidoreductase subunit D